MQLTPIANRTIFFFSAEFTAFCKSSWSLDSPSVITIKIFFAFDLEPLLAEKTLLLSKEKSTFNTCSCGTFLMKEN